MGKLLLTEFQLDWHVFNIVLSSNIFWVTVSLYDTSPDGLLEEKI